MLEGDSDLIGLVGLMYGEAGLLPTDAVADEVIDVGAVTQVAFEFLVDKLATYGNSVSEGHALALHSLLHRMARYCAGQAYGRVVFPLPTGMGKTTAIAALIVALTRLGYTVPLVIACKTIEAMAGLYQLLRDEEVPDHLIGLKHSDSRLHTTENDNRRYQFVTHERIRRDGATPLLLWHGGQVRPLCIYDETLLSGQATTIRTDDLYMGVAAFRALTEKGEAQAEVLRYLEAAMQAVDPAVVKLKQQGEIDCCPLRLPNASPEQLAKWQTVLLSRSSNLNAYGDRLVDFLEMSGDCRIVRTSQGLGLVSIEKCIPLELYNVMVLDASAPIRELAKLDSSLHIIEPWVAETKSFETVEVVQILAGGGRSTLEESMFGKDDVSPVSKEIIAILKERDSEASGEGVLFYLYKPKWRGDMQSKLKHDLRKAGINLEERVADDRPRFAFETWGRHEGTNDYHYCTTVILVGVLQVDFISIAGMIKAQKADLTFAVDGDALEKIHRGNIAHDVYQALSRGACRKVSNGIAHPMKAYIIHKDTNLQHDLAPVMPGVKWSQRDPASLRRAESGKAKSWAQKIATYLESLPSTMKEITSDVVKPAINFPTENVAAEKLFGRAKKQLGQFTQAWVPDGRRFLRI
jgi:hypothetical protein